ncbi:hypothetical protein EDC94DRAFT_584634 [Helicostylum pulchrum]|nr:hypothetical protein EDC94DRAFT_584634 [Helicostylum pulchrum]
MYDILSARYTSGLNFFYPFVPNFASPDVWEKTFSGKVCKPFTPKGLFQNVFSPGVCFLAEEPKGLMVIPPPASPFPSFCPFDPLPPLFKLISRAKAFASTAKALYQKLQVEGLNPNYLRFVLNMAFGLIAAIQLVL